MANNIIVGCNGLTLSTKEKQLFAELNPLGLILFARNITTPEQVIKLINQVKEAVGESELMVLIDQEGGRVSRLPSSHWRIPPSPSFFAHKYTLDPEVAKRACLVNAMLTGYELKQLGINVNCAPMLDIAQSSSAKFITERALGSYPQQVVSLGRQIVNGLKRAGVAPVIKHIPGHGRAVCDSHLELPKVQASIHELSDIDFKPFVAMADEAMAMTAHIVYEGIDRSSAATVSSKMINQIIRTQIGFNGLLMSDDINMQALSGSIASRAKAALKAGCDVALHCSGNYDEMLELLDVIEPLDGLALQRAQVAQSVAFKPATKLDPQALQNELDDLMKF